MSLMPTNEDRIYNQGYVAGRESFEPFEAMYQGLVAGYRFRIAELLAEDLDVWIVEMQWDYEDEGFSIERIVSHKPTENELKEMLADRFCEMIDEIPELQRDWGTKNLYYRDDKSHMYINISVPKYQGISCSYLEARAYQFNIG